MSFFVTSATSATGNLGGLGGSRCDVSTAGHRGRARHSQLARLSECRAGFRQPQSANERAGPDRHGPLVQRQPRARRQQPRPSCIRAQVTPPCSSTSAGSASTASGPVRRVRSSTTSSPGRTPMERSFAGSTCSDWTSGSASQAAQVGHSDGMGPNQSTAGALSSWNSSHASLNCADTSPRGGAGRFYCFAR